MGNQAEQLKVKFGSAWPGENKETEIVAIPGLLGRDPNVCFPPTIVNAPLHRVGGQACFFFFDHFR